MAYKATIESVVHLVTPRRLLIQLIVAVLVLRDRIMHLQSCMLIHDNTIMVVFLQAYVNVFEPFCQLLMIHSDPAAR